MSQGTLRIALFGQPRVVGDGNQEFPLPRKTLNVLAYLILKQQRPPTRDTVAFALFPDEDEERARGSLRRNLSYLLSSLPEGNVEPFVLADAERLAWNPRAPAEVDVLTFERALAEGRDDDALAAYGGLLLPTLYDEWTVADRERLREAANDALARTIARDRSRRRFDAATASARRLLEDDPWREDIVRQLMAVRYEAGDRAGAIATFAQFASRMTDEMGAEPMAETIALRDAILRGGRLATSEPLRAARSTPTSALPFVGRDDAMERAIERWHASADGRAGALFVAGEAGIGKSRFVAELARTIERDGGMTIIGETAAGGERRPYEALVDALRYAPGAPTGDVLDDSADVASSDDRSARIRLFESLRKTVVKLARARPLAIVLEDLHWAGPATIELLEWLIVRLGSAPVVIIGTYRDDELPLTHALRELLRTTDRSGRVERLALGRLDAADAALAAQSLAQAAIAPEALAAAVSWSEGVPLLLTESMRDLLAGRTFGADDFIDVLAARFARLDAKGQTALAYAAVVGARFELETLAVATGWRDDDVVDALAPAMDLGIVRAGSPNRGLSFVFSHHIIHAAALNRIEEADRTRAHLLVARALRSLFSGDERALEIAQHYAAAGERRRAAEHYAAGARYALSVFSNEDARNAATAGLSALGTAEGDRELRYELLATRERALMRLGAPERRADAEQMCEAAAGDDRRLCESLQRLIEATRTDKPAQRAAFARLEELGHGSQHARATFEKKVAEEAQIDGHFATALESAVRAARLFAQLGAPEDALRAELTRISCLGLMGEQAQAVAAVEDVRPSVEACADLSLQFQFYVAASNANMFGGHEQACADAQRAVDLALRVGDRTFEALARHTLALQLSAVGETARAMTEFESALHTFESIGTMSEAASTMFNLAGMRYWVGDYDGAHELLAQADPLCEGHPWLEVQNAAHRASMWLRAGDLDLAERYLLRTRELATEQQLVHWIALVHWCFAELAARRGQYDKARAELDAAMAGFEESGFSALLAQAHALAARIAADTGDTLAVRTALTTAMDLAAKTPPAELDTKFWWDIAAANALSGQSGEARRHAEHAARTFCDDAVAMRADSAESYGTLPWHVATFAYLQDREVNLRLFG